MPFGTEDLQQQLQALDEHPDWRAELRRRLIDGELLALTSALDRLANAQRRTEEHLGELAAAQARTEQRLNGIDQHLAELAAAQTASERRIGSLCPSTLS